jgi:hypothetical protein
MTSGQTRQNIEKEEASQFGQIDSDQDGKWLAGGAGK